MWTIVITQLSGGYSGIPRLAIRCVGSFRSKERAEEWAKHYGGDQWTAVLMEFPDDKKGLLS